MKYRNGDEMRIPFVKQQIDDVCLTGSRGRHQRRLIELIGGVDELSTVQHGALDGRQVAVSCRVSQTN